MNVAWLLSGGKEEPYEYCAMVVNLIWEGKQNQRVLSVYLFKQSLFSMEASLLYWSCGIFVKRQRWRLLCYTLKTTKPTVVLIGGECRNEGYGLGHPRVPWTVLQGGSLIHQFCSLKRKGCFVEVGMEAFTTRRANSLDKMIQANNIISALRKIHGKEWKNSLQKTQIEEI